MNNRLHIQLTRLLIAALVLLAAAHGTFAQAQTTFQNFYDDTGQLIKVIDSAGNVVEYVYDAAGNIVEVKRSRLSTPGALAILSFSPQRGGVGASVTIQGQGFGQTPSGNEVRFNGVPATVTSVAGGTLAVTVPAGATTGFISVKVGGVTAESGSPFTVVGTPGLTSISPRFTLSNATLSAVQVTGNNLTGSSFAFLPALVPPGLSVNSASVNQSGTAVTLNVQVNANAVGTFALVATNAAGSSDAFPSAANSLTVLNPTMDNDADGLVNSAEVSAGTDPLNPDTDGDRMSDGFEVRHGLKPLDASDAGADADGDGLTNLEEFRAGTDPRNADRVAPAVTQVFPGDGATNHPINGVIAARFSEPLLPESVVAGTVSLSRGTTGLAGTVTLSGDRLSVTFTPTLELNPQTAHAVRVQGVRDAAGNPMAAPFTSTFTTGVFVDTTPPTVVRTNPQSGATDVPVNTPFTVEFNERMDLGTLTAANFTVRDNTTFQNVAGVIQADASGRVVSFVPARPFAVGRGFFVSLGSEIKDAAGNRLGGRSFSFTTAFAPDNDRPLLVSNSPADGDAAVPTNAAVALQFSEPVNVINAARGVAVTAGGLPIPGSVALADGNKRLLFTPAQAYEQNTTFTVTTTAQITDLAGNTLANPGAFSFTTGNAPDNTRPVVTASNPVNGATGVGANATVQIRFDERLNPATINSSTFIIFPASTGVAVPAAVTPAADRRGATLTPASPLALGTTYFVQAFGIADLAGQELNFFQSSFTTALGPDTTAPTVTAVNPPNGATGVPVNARVIVRLSEPVSPVSLGANALTLTQGGAAVAGTVALSSDRTTLTFTPQNALAVSTAYAVGVAGFTDQAGNPVAAFNSTFTTGASNAADTTRPSVNSVTPFDGASLVPVNTTVSLTFSEALNPTSVGPNTVRVFTQSNGIDIPGAYVTSGATLTFTPSAPLPASTRMVVQVSGVEDLAGNTSNFFQSFFDTAAMADNVRPQVIGVTPPDGTAAVGPNAQVVLTFSEPIDPATISANNFALFAGGTRLSANVSRASDNRTVSLGAQLPPASLITVVVTSDVRDISGNHLSDFRSQFTTAPSFDTDRPSVISQRPANGATGVPLDTGVVLYINMPLDPATIPGALHVSQNGALVAGTASVSGGGKVVRFTPAAPFQTGALVQVFLDTSAKDTAGNALNNYQGSFTTLASTAATAPQVVRTSIGNSSNVVLNPVLEVEYNEPLDPTTVNATSVTLRRNDGTQTLVPGTVTLVRGGRVVRFVPGAQLAPSASYFFRVARAVKDLDGASPSFDSTFFFTTGTAADTTAPQVSLISPPDGAAGAGVNAQVHFRFSEPINPLSVTNQTALLTAGGAAVPATISFSIGDRDVFLVPHAPLPEATQVSVKIEGVEDLAGNPVVVKTIQFTTGTDADIEGPHVMRATPFNGATDVPVNTVITLETDEPVDPLTVDRNSFNVRDNITFDTVPGTFSVSPDGRTISYVPDQPLAVGRSHSVFFNRQGMLDYAGNFVTGTNYSFTTSFEPDTTPPQVTGVSPPAGLTGVPVNAEVVVQFSEPLDSRSVSQVVLSAGGAAVPVTRTLSAGNRLLSLRPDTLLSPQTLYTLNAAGVKDLAGNALASPFSSTFTTGTGADLIRPTVTGVNPANGATGVGTNATVIVSFSERVDALSVNSSNFIIHPQSTGVPAQGAVAVAPDGRSATFTLAAPLALSTTYIVQVFGITDLTGQDINFFQSSFTTALAADTTPPTVVAVSPPNGTTGVPVNARVELRVSEPVNPLSVSGNSVIVSQGGTTVAGSVALSSDRTTLTFTPTNPLAASTAYTVNAAGFRDQAGNQVAAFASSFNTAASATPDTTRPSVNSITPGNDAAFVPVNTTIVVTFSEAVNPTTAHADSIHVTVTQTGAKVAGSFNVSGATVTFTPAGPLPPSTRMSVVISGVEDLAGNTNNFFSSNFDTDVTADSTTPQVTMVTPGDGATGVGQNAQVVLTFSESLDPNTVNQNNFALFAGSTRQNANVSRSSDNRTVTLSMTLPPATLMTVIATRDVRDLSGNPLPDFRSQFTTAPSFDTDRPSVVGQRPANGASGVSPTSDVVLYVNMPLNVSTVPGALHISQNGVVVSGTLNVRSAGQVIQFTPAAPFQNNALVQVFLDASAQDPAGNALNNYQGSFRVAPGTATSAPQVVRVSQPNNSGVLLNAVVEIEYNEPLDPSTVSSATVSLRRNDGAQTPVASTISLVRGGRVVRIVPSAPLALNTPYFYRVTRNIKDLDGSSPNSDSTFFFTTGTAADTAAPQVSSVSPPDGVTGAGLNAQVRVRFSEPVNPLSVTAQTVLVQPAGGAVAVASAVSFSDNNREVLFVPHSPLPASTAITVKVEGVEDLAGNQVVAQTTQFTTGGAVDLTTPHVVRTNPFSGAADVPVNTTVTLEVDEPIDPLTVNANSFNVRDNVTFQSVAGSFSVSMDGRVITFLPNQPLAVGRSHSVFFANQGMQDYAGNFLTGPNFSFNTSFASDATPPQVTGVSPPAGLTGVPINAEVVVQFSEPVQALSAAGSAVAADRVFSDSNRRLTLKPRALLNPLTQYDVNVAGVKDLAGNALASPTSLSFMTGAGADLSRPFVASFDPASGANGVPVNVVVRLRFSERVNPLTVGASTFRLITNNTGVQVTGAYSISADGRTASFTPAAPLTASTSYHYQVFGVTDLTGQDVSFTQPGSFTTGAGADTTAPAVSALSPPDGSTGVPVNARVIVRLSEPVSAVSLGDDALILKLGATRVAGTTSLSNERDTLTFTPANPLAVSSAYTIEVAGLADLAGNVSTPLTTTFNTSASNAADTTRPSVTSVNPGNSATGVPVNAAVVVNFNEPVDPTTVNANTMSVTVQSSGIRIPGAYAVSGTSMTFMPSSSLPANTRIQVAVSGVADLAGNTNNFFFSTFDTGGVADTTPPQVTMVTPTGGATNVGLNTSVVLTFSEPLNPNTINSNTFALFAGGERINVGVNRSADNQTVTMSTTLPASSLITVVATRDVLDLAGNPLPDFSSQFTTASQDTNRPSVVVQRPGNGASGVPADKSVVLYVNEPLDASTVEGALQVSADGEVVAGTVQVTGGGQVIEFTLNSPFEDNALVQVFLDTSAQDLAGNPLNNYQGSFRVAGGTATTAPQVVRLSQSNNSNVLRNAVLEVEYNEPLDPSTVGASTVSLRLNDGAQTVVASTISLVRGGRVVRIVPSAPLAASTGYFYRVTSGVKDLDGTSPNSDSTFFFVTGTATDTVAPQVAGVSPPDGAMGAGVNAQVHVRFSEPVNPLSITDQTVMIMAGGGSVMPSSVSFSDNNRELLVVPHAPLPEAMQVSVKVEGVEDLAGNQVTAQTTQFTTASSPDVNRPSVVRTNPFVSATDVPVNTVVTLEVDEAIDPLTVNAQTFEVRDNTTFQAVPGTRSISMDGRTISFVPDQPFAAGRSHSVFFSFRGMQDYVGNFLAGSDFSFNTSNAADAAPPQVTGVSPPNSLTGVPINAEVVVQFSEPVQTSSADQVTLSAGGSAVAVTRTFSDGNRVLKLRPKSPLAAQTAHAVNIAGVRDLAGNVLASPVTSNFTTGSGADLLRPSVTSVSPQHGATNVGVNSVVTVQFSERVNPLTVGPSTFRVLLANTGVSVAGVITVSADGLNASFTPSGGLAASTTYIVQVFGVTDLTGQDVNFFQSSFTTGP
ncbi:MAG: Ig-like domain-containing protein [Acidobacteria bacterium]|nr:Ig-like domain-containing protein [Acidobacteriota bacterium]MCA1619584.1 Ig-like domain-containing protein [Acidobacteriota bacterium]